EQRHMAALRALEPKARSRMALLGKWQGDAEVADPYGRDLAFFERTFVTIEALANDWMQRLA
nr:low molecular weight phosphotyrosine protein phosphatase [Pseudomonadota bacterium]